jgi:hypothetical protein
MRPSLMLRLLPLADATLVPDRPTAHAARAAMRSSPPSPEDPA